MLRIRWPFLVAAVLAAIAAVLTYLWPRADGVAVAQELPTAAQARPAADLAASLPVVPGSRRDPYDTACGFPTPYCVTSASLSARQLATRIQAMLLARGARVAKPLSCDSTCRALLDVGGIGIGVTADEPRDFNGVQRPARAFVVIVEDSDTPPFSPLPAWSALRLMPATWGTPRCSQRYAGGCVLYHETLTIHAPLTQVHRVLLREFAASGYALDGAMCFPYPGGRPQGCTIFGQKFRHVGGQDPVYAAFEIAATGPRTTKLTLRVNP